METTRATATESLGASEPSPSHENHLHAPGTSPASPLIKVRRRTVFDSEKGKDIDLFTMTIGEETIELMPLRNWGQLDVYKWRAQGRLPGTPAGLEITHDHIKLVGETVKNDDPDGCAKLEKLFAEWLAMEKQSLELARQKAKTKPAAAQQTAAPAEFQPTRYAVEVDKAGQVHIRCTQGKETVATIGLNAAGFQSLFTQGLMKKPKALHVGALHDWVEIDGVLFSFEKGNNDSEKLAATLNGKYAPPRSHGGGKDVVIYANRRPRRASTCSSRFGRRDVGSEAKTFKRGIFGAAARPEQVRVVARGIVIKIARPNLIFKQKTPDGGEKYLDTTRRTRRWLLMKTGSSASST